MNKTTLTAQGAAGITMLALIAAMVQAKPLQYDAVRVLEIDMSEAVLAASEEFSGTVVEAELENEKGQIVWEIDIVDEHGQLIEVELDGQTGQIMSRVPDDDAPLGDDVLIGLSQAIELVTAIESGALIEAELENDDGLLIWEIEALGSNNQDRTYRVDAETGEILI